MPESQDNWEYVGDISSRIRIKTAQKKAQTKPIDAAQHMFDKGYVEIASFNGERLFINGEELCYGIEENYKFAMSALINAVHPSLIEAYHVKDSSINIVPDPNRVSRYLIESKKNLFSAEPKIKITEVKVIINEEGEIIQGKETLEKFNLLGVRKLDKKEESIINVRELADFLAQEEAERIHIGFHPEKDKGKYDELYKKHYKNIIKFRSKN